LSDFRVADFGLDFRVTNVAIILVGTMYVKTEMIVEVNIAAAADNSF